MLADGETNARIAERLVVSEDTVKTHVKHILRKLGVRNRSQAVSRYFRTRDAHGATPLDGGQRKMPLWGTRITPSPDAPAGARGLGSLRWNASIFRRRNGRGNEHASGCGRRSASTSRVGSERASPLARPLLSIVVPTKNELGNVAALIERLETVLPTVAMEIIFVDASTDGTARVRSRARARRRSARCGLAPPDRRPPAQRGSAPPSSRACAPPRLVGLRHGRRPPAPAGAGRRAARAGRVAASSTSWSRAATAARRRLRSLGWARAMASRSTTSASADAVPAPPARRERSDERVLPRAPRRRRPRGASAARIQDPARAPDPQSGAPHRRGVLHVRRASRRPEQGDHPRRPALPVAPRRACASPASGSSGRPVSS